MADEACFNFGLEGLGKVEVSGTNEFVQAASKHLLPLISMTYDHWLQKRRAQGLTTEAAEAEFAKAWDEAVANMKTLANANKAVEMELAR
jgi:hypothetical protein